MSIFKGIQGIEVGSFVTYSRGSSAMGRSTVLAQVERLTKTQAILDNGTRWMLRSARMVGSDSWSGVGSLRLLVGDEIEKVRQTARREKLLHLTAALCDDVRRLCYSAGSTMMQAGDLETAINALDKLSKSCGGRGVQS